MDTGDKAINKAMAIAYKYLCFQLFCIPVDDMADPDAESPEMDDEKPQEDSKKDKAPSTAEKKGPGKAHPDSDKPAQKGAPVQENREGKVTEAMINTVRSEQKRTGVSDKAILSRLHSKAKKIEDMTVEEFNQVMKIFEVTRDLKQEAGDEHK